MSYRPYLHINGVWDMPHGDLINQELDLSAILAGEARTTEAHYEGYSRFPARAAGALRAAVDDARAVAAAQVDRSDPAALAVRVGALNAALLALADAVERALAFKTFPASRRRFAEQQIVDMRELAAGGHPQSYHGRARLDHSLRLLRGKSPFGSWFVDELAG